MTQITDAKILILSTNGFEQSELLRPDPHDTPVLFLVCPCGYWEAAPADIEAELEGRDRMPGF